MSNNNSLTAKCPVCGTQAKQNEISEKCLLLNDQCDNSSERLLSVCLNSDAIKEYHASGMTTEDPCSSCTKNYIEETTGTFIGMEQGSRPNTWREIHLCPTCNTTYTINPSEN